MRKTIHIDFRLVDVSLELQALEDHLELLVTQLADLRETERTSFSEYVQNNELAQDEYDLVRQEIEYKVDVLLPRFFWGSFLASLFAVYETALTEVAKLIQTSKKLKVSMNDLRGDLLERASKYYEDILEFELFGVPETRERIRILAELRNAITHVNGRLDMLKTQSRARIESWVAQGIGISSYNNYLLVDEEFVTDTFAKIRLSLEDLVARYKSWDDQLAPN